MPYDIFGDPIDHWPTDEEIEQERRWCWFGAGAVIGFLIGLAVVIF